MPYAYGAKIRHEFLVDHLNVWLTFRHPMQRSEIPQADPPVYDWMPPLNLWLLEADAAPVDIIDSEWQDQFTLLLTSDTIVAEPNRVLLAYAGPDEHLQTTWGKDWEPWGPILSTNIVKFPCFVDRGDPAAYDFLKPDFTIDTLWHELDLSSIIPVGVKSVLLRLGWESSTAGNNITWRTPGNTGIFNVDLSSQLYAGQPVCCNVIVAPNAELKIEYRITSGTYYHIGLTVAGWWF